jgi:hypothetical protein
MATPGDGVIYYASGLDVIALELPAMKFSTIGSAPEKIEKIATSTTGAVYVSCGPGVYRIRGAK